MAGRRRLPVAQGESPRDVGGLGFAAQAGLAAGPSAAAEQPLRARRPERPRHLACDDRRLVVATSPVPCPVQRDGDHEVHVRVEGRGGQARAQPARRPASRAEVAVVFECLRDLLVAGVRPIMIKSRSIRIRLIFIDLYLGVETVGHRIVAERVVARLREVRQTLQAEVPLLREEGTATHHARSRQDQVQQRRE